jgi:MFS transporter, YNFM family, putative membrane transport protein
MDTHLRPGTKAFRAAYLGLFAAGYGAFFALYCVQPLLPRFAETFAVGATGSSFALSAATGSLAVGLLAMSLVSDRLGRKAVMAASLSASAVLTLAAAASPGWAALLALRGLTGLALSGVPAVAMAYMGEEVDREGLPRAMGLYISGAAVGGLSGRIVAGVVADVTGSWRLALLVVGLGVLACALGVLKLLPPSRHFAPALPRRLGGQLAIFMTHLRDPVMVLLFLSGFLLLGGFVCLYNYTGFRLVGPPYHLTEAVISTIFLAYLLAGPASSAFGRLRLKLGPAPVLLLAFPLMLAGTALTLWPQLPLIGLGVALYTFGLFGCHALASAWVTQRAQQGRSQASALYLFFYYLGSTVLGPCGAAAWAAFGWTGVAVFLAGLLLLQGLAGLGLFAAARGGPGERL